MSGRHHAVSRKQQRLMGAALAMKRGEARPRGMAAKVAGQMSEKKLREHARMTAAKRMS